MQRVTLGIKHGIRHWIRAFRPRTLTAAVVPIVAATALVMALNFSPEWWISAMALIASLFIQIGTNLINDAVDFKKGADTHERVGPQRVTQAGLFSVTTVLSVGFLFLLLALFCGIPLVLRGGWPIFWIGISALVCGYAYTGGPFPLAYRGLGDIFVILFFGVIAVSGLFYLHTGQWKTEAFVLGLQVGLHCAVLIAINNLRDVEGDKLVQKKTLPVRFGRRFARYEIALLCLVPFIFQIYWMGIGFPWAAGLAFAALPLAIQIVKSVFSTEPSPVYNEFLARAAGLHLAFGFLLSLGLLAGLLG